MYKLKTNIFSSLVFIILLSGFGLETLHPFLHAHNSPEIVHQHDSENGVSTLNSTDSHETVSDTCFYCTLSSQLTFYQEVETTDQFSAVSDYLIVTSFFHYPDFYLNVVLLRGPPLV